MTTDRLLERMKLSLDELIVAARRTEAARAALSAKPRPAWHRDEIMAFVQAELGAKAEDVPRRIAEAEAIAGVLENLKLGQTYAVDLAAHAAATSTAKGGAS